VKERNERAEEGGGGGTEITTIHDCCAIYGVSVCVCVIQSIQIHASKSNFLYGIPPRSHSSSRACSHWLQARKQFKKCWRVKLFKNQLYYYFLCIQRECVSESMCERRWKLLQCVCRHFLWEENEEPNLIFSTRAQPCVLSLSLGIYTHVCTPTHNTRLIHSVLNVF
jgi:hypothetical protein